MDNTFNVIAAFLMWVFFFIGGGFGYLTGLRHGEEINYQEITEQIGQCAARAVDLENCALENGWDLKNG